MARRRSDLPPDDQVRRPDGRRWTVDELAQLPEFRVGGLIHDAKHGSAWRQWLIDFMNGRPVEYESPPSEPPERNLRAV